jgi:carbonic anhydrase
MSQIDELLDANEAHAAVRGPSGDAPPRRRLTVLTCMDARIDPLAVFGLREGDAQILRNAGARVTDDVLRGLALSAHLMGVDTVVVVQHTRCGLVDTTGEDLRGTTGADTDFLVIHDHAETLRSDVDALAATAYLTPIREIAGLVYDVDSGAVTEHVRWERSS